MSRLRISQRQDQLGGDTADVVSLQLKGFANKPLSIVNVYNAPRGCDDQEEGARVVTGTRWEGAEHAVLVAGDFNAHAEEWATEHWNKRTNAAGKLLSRWMEAQNWTLGLEPGSATRGIGSPKGGAALDLVFISPALQRLDWVEDCRVRTDLVTGADHEVIWTELRGKEGDGNETRPAGRLSERRTDEQQLFSEFDALKATYESVVDRASAAAEQGAPDASDHLERAAEALHGAMRTALEASTPRSTGRKGGYVWWNDQCKEALERMNRRRPGQGRPRSRRQATERFAQARSRFRKAVVKAKRAWAKQKIEELQGNDIFGAMKWSEGRRRYRSPPLMGADGALQVETAAKADTLRNVLLPTPIRTNLPHIDYHSPRPNTIADQPLTEHEVEKALFDQNPNKAPGPDEVGFLTLRRLWSRAKGAIFKILEACLRIGCHPSIFRQATLVALKKDGNRDPAEPRSYRLISLLPCLGKVLEKVVARRLTFYAEKYGWVPPEQFGGMPGRGTDDAALTLVHDIEAGWAQRQQRTTSALAFDVKGAFDATHWERLAHLLYALGCPLQLVRWVVSFLTNRQAELRLDDETTAMTPLSTGIPQGSPVSLILFIIFVGPLLKLFGPQSADRKLRRLRVIGYVDDGLMYTSSHSAEQNNEILSYGYKAAVQWAEGAGLAFDPKKRELIHFPPPFARNLGDEPQHPEINLDDGTVEPGGTDTTMRWLGYHLDSKLSFKRHVDIVSTKARKAAHCMRMLVNTVRGLRASDARRLYVACVLPIMTFGAVVWWQGRQRYSRPQLERGGGGAEQQGVAVRGAVSMVKRLEQEQVHALRMVLPVWRTTNIHALQIESGCMPMETYLDKTLNKFALGLAKRAPNHTLMRRAGDFGTTTGQTYTALNRAQRPPVRIDSTRSGLRRTETRFTLLAARCDSNIERGGWERPPWWTQLGAMEEVTLKSAGDFPREKEEAARVIELDIGSRREEICVFSDGSRMDSGETGAGWVVFVRGAEIKSGAVKTGSSREVFDAEVMGMLCGFDYAFRYAREHNITTITIYVDNNAALQAVANGNSNSSLGLVKALDKRARRWLQKDSSNRLRLSWVPGHAEVAGNERADELAKEGARSEGPVYLPATSVSFSKRQTSSYSAALSTGPWDPSPNSDRTR
ncbi:hypothetical protein CF326_g2580 [Tilletia indica]|nr:hypothetical protein CF326_g2580 [Tilletia indica]